MMPDERSALRAVEPLPSMLALAALLAGCAGGPPARSAAIDRVELIKAAAFDHDCPPAQVHVLEARAPDDATTPMFVLDVCGAARRYVRVGSMYFDASLRGTDSYDPS